MTRKDYKKIGKILNKQWFSLFFETVNKKGKK